MSDNPEDFLTTHALCWDKDPPKQRPRQEISMANVIVEPTKDGRFQVEFADKSAPLGPFATQAEAIEKAKAGGHHPLVARVRNLNDKSILDHWRAA